MLLLRRLQDMVRRTIEKERVPYHIIIIICGPASTNQEGSMSACLRSSELPCAMGNRLKRRHSRHCSWGGMRLGTVACNKFEYNSSASIRCLEGHVVYSNFLRTLSAAKGAFAAEGAIGELHSRDIATLYLKRLQ